MINQWLLFCILVLSALIADLWFFSGKKKERISDALFRSLFWIMLSLGFAVYVYFFHGKEDALTFLTGYLIEKSLSIDNLFVFLLIFDYFGTPKENTHKVLFWGVFGAVVLRAIMIAGGLVLIQTFHSIIYIFGLFLIYTGIKFWFAKDTSFDAKNNPILRLFRRYFPLYPQYEGDKFFVKMNRKTLATPLFLVLIAIETSDVIFAIDSIPAILAITTDPFIVYTSNIFALLGLRSLFFVLEEGKRLFHTLHYGLSVILILIGCKMIISSWIEIPILPVLGLIVSILLISVLLSLKPLTKKN